MNSIFYYVVFTLSGLIIGSFLEVVSYRIPRKISLVKPGSFCPGCKKEIAFYDNVPLLSYIILKGRCRKCKVRISARAPLIETLTAFLFVLNYAFFNISLMALNGIILCCLLIAVSFIDIDFRIIPNIIVLPFTLTGIAVNAVINPVRWWTPLAFSAGAFAFMLIINLIYPRGMGMGDVKLSLMIGAFLVKSVIVALFLGFLIGSIFGIFVLIKKRRLKLTISFGPFISAGSIIALFYGNNILKWYTSFLF